MMTAWIAVFGSVVDAILINRTSGEMLQLTGSTEAKSQNEKRNCMRN
jgi:hypothetical protein